MFFTIIENDATPLELFFNDKNLDRKIKEKVQSLIKEVMVKKCYDDPIVNQFFYDLVIKRSLTLQQAFLKVENDLEREERFENAGEKGDIEMENKGDNNKDIDNINNINNDNNVNTNGSSMNSPQIKEKPQIKNENKAINEVKKEKGIITSNTKVGQGLNNNKESAKQNKNLESDPIDKIPFSRNGIKFKRPINIEFTAVPNVVKEDKIITEPVNPHQILHDQRVFLMNQAILKYYNVRDFSQIKDRRLLFISPAADLSKYLYHNHKAFVNTAITDDPNDIVRGVLFLTSIFNSWNGEGNLLDNWCSCYQDKVPCQHIIKFAPQLVLLPHSIYYLPDELINWFLNNGLDIIATMHVFNADTSGRIVREGRRLKYNHNRKKNGKDKPEDEFVKQNYIISEYKEESGYVTMDIKDDKIYNHRHSCPLLYNTSNSTTLTTVTKVTQRFRFVNMDHISIVIKGTVGIKNDFNSYLTVNRKNYGMILSTDTNVQEINNDLKGNYYLKKLENDDNMLLRILDNKTECFYVRAEHVSILNLLWHKTTGGIMDRNFDSFFKQFKMTHEGGRFAIDNEAYNTIYSAALQLKKYDFETVYTLYLKSLAIIGRKTVDSFLIYGLLRVILADVFKAKMMVQNLTDTKFMKALNNMPLKKNKFDRIYDYFIPATNIDHNLNLIRRNKSQKKVNYNRNKVKYPVYQGKNERIDIKNLPFQKTNMPVWFKDEANSETNNSDSLEKMPINDISLCQTVQSTDSPTNSTLISDESSDRYSSITNDITKDLQQEAIVRQYKRRKNLKFKLFNTIRNTFAGKESMNYQIYG